MQEKDAKKDVGSTLNFLHLFFLNELFLLSLIFLHKISNQVADDSNHHAVDGGNPPV